MTLRTTLRLLACTLVAGAALKAAAQAPMPNDWPQWRGPDRTGVSRETGLMQDWPPTGPAVVWKADGLGGGYSTPSVYRGRIFGMGYKGPEEVVWALDAATGKPAWTTAIAQANTRIGYGDGSRSTPTHDGDRCYVVGASGDVVCLGNQDGKVRWQRSFTREFGGRIPNWGYSESPLVDGNKVIVTPGGPGATMVALNKMTGEIIWRGASPEGDSAHYCSPIKAVAAGVPQYIVFVSGGVVSFGAEDGRFLWRYNNPANGTANISTVLFRNDHVFAATAYRTGGGLAKISRAGNAFRADEVYFTRQMQNHHGGMVLVGDYLYGFDDNRLTCINFMTGEVKWADRSVGKGSVTFADGRIYARSERGPVALVEANPNAYVEKGQFMQAERSGKAAWPHPVVSNGRLYLRDQDVMFCYDVKRK